MLLFKKKISFDNFCEYIFTNIYSEEYHLDYDEYMQITNSTSLSRENYKELTENLPILRCTLASVELYREIQLNKIKIANRKNIRLRLETNLYGALKSLGIYEYEIEMMMSVYKDEFSDIDDYFRDKATEDILLDYTKPLSTNLIEDYESSHLLYNDYHQFVFLEAISIRRFIKQEKDRFNFVDFTEDNKIENQEISVAFAFGPENSYVSGDRKISEYDDEILISLLTVFIARFLYVSKKSEFQVFKNHLLNYFENFLSIENQSDVKLQDQLLNIIHSQFETVELLAYCLMCEKYSFPPEDIYEDDLNRSKVRIINSNDYVLTLYINSAYTKKKLFSNNIRKINKVGLNLKMPQQEGINKIYLPVILRYLTKEILANVSDLESAQKAILLFLKSVNSRNFVEYVLVNKALQKAEIF